MPLGTLSGKPGPRMIVPVELIRELKLDIEINLNESLDYEKLNLENTTYQDSISIIIKCKYIITYKSINNLFYFNKILTMLPYYFLYFLP